MNESRENTLYSVLDVQHTIRVFLIWRMQTRVSGIMHFSHTGLCY